MNFLWDRCIKFSLICSCAAPCFFAGPALAQVFNSGPSPSGLFDTVISLPTENFIETKSIGGVAGETTQLNVNLGGNISIVFPCVGYGCEYDPFFDSLILNAGAELNVDGGNVERRLTANSDSEINISDGSAGFDFSGSLGSEVNISGGTFGFPSNNFAGTSGRLNMSGGLLDGSFSAESGSRVNISGGRLVDFWALSGSDVDVSGGTLGFFTTRSGSDVTIVGGEFRRNGVDFPLPEFPFELLSIGTFSMGDVFTGTLADGSPFVVFNANSTFQVLEQSVALNMVPLPAADLNPIVVDSPMTSGPFGLRAGQTMTVLDGGELSDDFTVVEATLNVEDGIVGRARVANGVLNVTGGEVSNSSFAIGDSEVNISGGRVRSQFDAWFGAELNVTGGELGNSANVVSAVANISGGSVGDFFVARSGSVVNISGGDVGRSFDVLSGSVVNISGGNIGRDFEVRSGEVNISGGTLGDDFDVWADGVVNISGGRFEDDFVVASGGTVTISGGSFPESVRFRNRTGSNVELVGGEFQLNGVDFVDSKITFDSFNQIFTGTLEDGSRFIFRSGSVRDFLSNVTLTTTPLPAADLTPIIVSAPTNSSLSSLRPGQTMTVLDGGDLGDDWAVVDATLNVESGTVGQDAIAVAATVNISGGEVGNAFEATNGTEVNVSGGRIGTNFTLSSGSVLNVSGGTILGFFNAFDTTKVNLFGTEFLIDGVSLNSLTPDEAFTITSREGTISAELSDGSQFIQDLGRFSTDSTLTVTRPTSVLGDVNLDGNVGFLDIIPFVEVLRTAGYQHEADVDQNGVVDFLDIGPFITILFGQ